MVAGALGGFHVVPNERAEDDALINCQKNLEAEVNSMC